MATDLRPDPFDTLRVTDEVHDEQRAASGRVRVLRRRLRSALDFAILVVAAFLTAIIVETFFVQAFFIPSGSMEQTLNVDDWVVVNKLAYRFGEVQRGDIVVFDEITLGTVPEESLIGSVTRTVGEALGTRTPGVELIKRVIALEGETIEIRGGAVYIDDLLLVEDYLAPGTVMRSFGPVTVPSGEVFVMGDNRNRSKDSREFGTVPADVIVGRALAVVWPTENWDGL
jgi:signal peptidase I